MPAWVAQERDDEVWAVVAFLKRLPRARSQTAYRELALGVGRARAAERPRDRDVGRADADAVGACARCHGDERRGPASALVPVLHGQPVEFLAAALAGICRRPAAERHHAAGRQPSFAPTRSRSSPHYYAGLAIAEARLAPSHRRHDAVARSRRRAIRTRRFRPASRCHGAEALPIYPRLAGQNAAYMANRLRLWKNGPAASVRHRGDHGADRAPAQRRADRGRRLPISRACRPNAQRGTRAMSARRCSLRCRSLLLARLPRQAIGARRRTASQADRDRTAVLDAVRRRRRSFC